MHVVRLGTWSLLPLGLLLVGCGDSGGGQTDGGGADGDDQTLKITITSPEEGATGVSVTKPSLVATFNRALAKPDLLEVTLEREGKVFHGLKTYSATELRVIFEPFNILQSRASYTFKVAAEGVEAKVGFTTEKANEGPLPPVVDKTYDFRLKEVIYPKDLAQVFNSQLQSAPPVLMHVVSVTDEGAVDGNNKGAFLIAGSIGKAGDPAGQAQVIAEDAEHPTTTSTAINGRMEGTWFGAGPSDLHMTASGIPLVIRDFYVTGVFAADGSNMTAVQLTGVLDPAELGKALGGLDLTFICTDARFKKYCDDKGRIRLAATVETTPNPIVFTTFITTPINNSVDVDASTKIQIYFSEEVDSTTTTAKLTDESAAEVAGKLAFESKAASFTPDAALAAGTKYTVEVVGASKAGGSDTRHASFTTK